MPSDDRAPQNDEMFVVAYDELRRLARRLHRQSDSPTLNATALVHEAYLKLAKSGRYQAETLGHLKCTVALAMRQILFDAARRRSTVVRGGGSMPARRLSLDDPSADAATLDPTHLMLMEIELARMASHNELQARVFNLQFFGGFQVSEIAETIGVSEKRVQRLLRMAKASLARALAPGDAGAGSGA